MTEILNKSFWLFEHLDLELVWDLEFGVWDLE